jgi:hypothetical protein
MHGGTHQGLRRRNLLGWGEAAEEPKATILAGYPDAQFTLSRAPDDRHIWLLWTFVDVDDPDDARDLTKEREVELLVEDHVAAYVSPTSRPEIIYGYGAPAARKTG